MMQKQSNNGVKGKEAEVVKERRPDSQPRRNVLNEIDKTTSKSQQNSLKSIATNILVDEVTTLLKYLFPSRFCFVTAVLSEKNPSIQIFYSA